MFHEFQPSIFISIVKILCRKTAHQTEHCKTSAGFVYWFIPTIIYSVSRLSRPSMSLAASSAGSDDCGVKKESEETDRRVKNEPEKPCHRVFVKQEPKEELGEVHCIHIKKEADGNAIPVKEPPWDQYGLPECYAGIKVEVKLEPVSEESQPLASSVRPTSPTLAVGSQAKHEEPNNSVSPEPSAGSRGRTSHQPSSPIKSTGHSALNKHSELHSWNAQPVNQVLKTNLEGEQTTVEKKLTCNVCTKQFKRKGDLVKHSRAHSGVRPYSCDICIKQFARNGDLLKHRRTHTGEKPYTCKLCPKQFTRNGDLVIHSRTHTGEKPYSCKTCPKQFTRKSILVQHILTHTGEKPYFCKVCSRKFTQKSNLIVHRRIHTGEKPYTCDVCMKQFAHKNGLAVHRQIHNKGLPCSYICDICSKEFIEKNDLVAHLRTHTEEKGCP